MPGLARRTLAACSQSGVDHFRITGLFTGGQDRQQVPISDALELETPTISFNEFIDMPNRLPERRVKMVFGSVVGPTLMARVLPV